MIDPSDWTVEQCWTFLENTLGIDINTIDTIDDNDVEAWRNYVEARLDDEEMDGTSGQDRESYTDDQDRDSYTVDEDTP